MDLTDKKCIPCHGGLPALKKKNAEIFLKKVDDWALSNDATKITKQFKFKNFVEAMKFVNKVAEIAEQEAHHPDILINWNKVTLELTTHAIKGLHENDFILAAKIDIYNT